MRRDMDLIRELMIKIEDQGADQNSWVPAIEVSGFSRNQIDYHLWLLLDASLIVATDTSSSSGSSIAPHCLTWNGHEFLSSVRDKEIWRLAKEGAKRGGSEALEFIWKLALAYAKRKIEDQTGVRLE